jgi:DNA adenine methylase
MNNSPIRYFGGKNGFANKIIDYFPDNYEDMSYIEPYFGSGGIYFHKNPSKIEIINDIYDNVYSLFKVLIDKELFDRFKNKCDLTLYSEKLLNEYNKDLEKELDIEERAYKFFYTNRVSYNGIGGLSISHIVRRGMSKSISDYLSSIDKLFDIHNRLSNTIILNRDAIDIIKNNDKNNIFIYLDPPYVLATRSSGSYKHDYTDEDQDNLIEILKDIKNSKILLSGYNNDKYSILEDIGWKRVDIEIKTQNNNIKGRSKIESLWSNY